MKPGNLLFILSDEHARQGLGCYGNPLVRTPVLDRLAARGTRFTQAYTPSPICVPARASLATGRYVHEIGCWSSAEPYHGQVPGWGHQLIEAGHEVVSVGKLHYRSSADDNGFSQEILPLHVVEGVGWIRGLLRESPPRFEAARELARDIGAGWSSYTRYDKSVCDAACAWLRDEGAKRAEKPWVLLVSFVSPHYPLKAPEPFFRLYDGVEIPDPVTGPQPTHPVLAALRDFFDYDDHFDAAGRAVARQAYYGLCSFLDHQVGRLLESLEAAGLAEETRIVYTTDHGEMLGKHGFWTKSVMYEESAAVPLILAGDGVPKGAAVDTPASLIDLYPTILEAAGVPAPGDGPRHGRSLFDLAQGAKPERSVLSEYHDGGSIAGFYLLRLGDWKYVHYAGHPPQLFNLAEDPDELTDLGLDPACEVVRREAEVRLRDLLDPEAVNARAFADQKARIAALGGEACLLARADFNHTPLAAESRAG